MQDMHLFNAYAYAIKEKVFWKRAQSALRAMKKEMLQRGIPVPALEDLQK